MAHTRGASHKFHQDDGVMLDRQGNPISPAATLLTNQRNIAGHEVLHGPGAEPVPEQMPITAYRADRNSWSQNMEAFELARLIDLAFNGGHKKDLVDGFVVTLTPDEYTRLDGNLRRHFMAVRG